MHYNDVPLIILFILIGGTLDRGRGDATGYPRILEKIIYGGFIAAILAITDDWWGIYVVSCWVLGCSWGWGGPLGAYLGGYTMEHERAELWQICGLQRHALLSLWVRGAMWGAPLALYSVPLAIMVSASFPISAIIAKWTANITYRHFLKLFLSLPSSWEMAEYLRGMMMAASAVGVYFWGVN